MSDLRDPRLMYLKGGLFVAIGTMASALLLIESPTAKTALLLGLAIWAFCRAYFFAFYVIEHYIDPGCRVAGLFDFFLYLLRRRPRDDAKSK